MREVREALHGKESHQQVVFEVYGLKMVKCVNFLKHLNMFNQLLDQLYKVNIRVEEENKAFLLLISLLDCYKCLVTMLLFGKNTISLENITSSFLSN